MNLDEKIFGKYDIRGIVGNTITSEIVYDIARAYGTFIQSKEGKKVALGRDVRPSSIDFYNAAVRGLLDVGCEVTAIGLVPTPLMYFAVDKLGLDGGMMITASHNPPEYNGIKLRRKDNPLTTQEIKELYHIIENERFEAGNGTRKEKDIVSDYIQTIVNKIKLQRNLKVVVDPGNGTNGPIVSRIYSALGIHFSCICCEPDGRFPNHHPDPSEEENLLILQEAVVKENAELGIAFDGDGDRLGVVDDRGITVHPDIYMTLLVREIFSSHTGTAVFDVRTSQGLIAQVEDLGSNVVLSEGGYPNILRHMRENNAEFGGESTGHIYFNDPDIHFDDAIFASLRLLVYLSNVSKSVSALVDELPKLFNTPEIRIKCSNETKNQVVDQISDIFIDRGFTIIKIDGVRIAFPDGWALIRPSNTESKLSMRFESTSKSGLARIIRDVQSVLESLTQLDLQELSDYQAS
jgi:phosphomannomutase / phosphoglucomutase